MIRRLLTLCLLMTPCLAGAENAPAVTVLEPYIELHTGPGRGYPVFHVAAAGEQILILKQRTSWFLVETVERHPKKGWARLTDVSRTAANVSDDETVYVVVPGDRRRDVSWQWSAAGGDFGGASSISVSLGYKLTNNIRLQLEGSQILGDFSDGKMLSASVLHFPFPHWRVAPYFQLGTGMLQTEPSATLVQAEDRRDNTLSVGAGLSLELGRRFNLFMDYRRHTVLTSRDENEEINQWKLGINVSL